MSIWQNLLERAENATKPKGKTTGAEKLQQHQETAGVNPFMSKREALLTLIQDDLGEFPFEALWPQREEGSLVKIISIITLIMVFVVAISVWTK